MAERSYLYFTQDELKIILQWADVAHLTEEEKEVYEYIFNNIQGNAR